MVIFIYTSNLVKIFWLVAEICRQIKFETTPSGGKILLPVYISTRVYLRHIHMCDDKKISDITHRPVTAPNAPFTNQSSPYLSQSAKCRIGNTQNGGTVLGKSDADSESGSPVSYSSFLLTIVYLA